ncbi:MAG TPA: PP2C family protein-serine/threonine phosphatase [Gemmataceae bacterium]|nr:PP2C family protein-serine/threonine phosphatase [Gemmataceae bacterium]
MEAPVGLFDEVAHNWQERLDLIVETMKEMSRQTDPQEMSQAYGKRMQTLRPIDRRVSLSRRGLQYPWFRVTRCTLWKEDINPWKEPHRLPLLKGGLFAELIYSDEPRLFDNVQLPDDDPAAEYVAGMASLGAIPMYDQGVALNMVLIMRQEASAFPQEQFPEIVWLSNLFGRATHNLVLSEQLKAAYEAVDYEMKVVADIQRSLLPKKMPDIPTMSLAAYYRASHRAGGDYYDFFPLPDGKWGILIADVSGHGTPAAVLMAITHSLAHSYPGAPMPPGRMLEHVNHHLTTRYTVESDTFVTAFYGVYDPSRRELAYASAGHNPPRLKRCVDGTLDLLNGATALPLGIAPNQTYREQTYRLVPGDELVLYTDGITEAHNDKGEMFGLARLDKVLENCAIGAPDLLESVLAALTEFTGSEPIHDDRTMLVAKIS